MSDPSAHPIVPRPLAAHAAVLVGALVVIWALTGARYFWPMWPALGASMVVGLVAAGHWARHRAHAAGKAMGFGVIGAACVAIWLMTGTGYFWPMWPLLGMAIPATIILLTERRPREQELAGRVQELTRTRSGALDVQATELRRIERDLHDGAQARLVALSMQLGRAEERLAAAADPEIAGLVRRAKEEATAAIAELRDLARGISPPVLSDRGLEAAVQSLADRTGANVSVNADLPQRPSPAVENAAYFVVAEALTNAAKHAPGAAVRVTLWAEAGELGIVVADEGLGGADPAGNGLVGLRQRVEALDGWLELSSPVGEGTTIRAVLPCAW